MTELLRRFVHPNLLWHASPVETRERILSEGLRPRGAARWYQRKRPVWFYNSALQYCAASETGGGVHGYLCALEWQTAEQGLDFSYESPHVVTVYRQVPPTEILTDFPCERAQSPRALREVVNEALGRHWAQEVAHRCDDRTLRWKHQTSLAWTLLSLDPATYDAARLSDRLIGDSVSGDVDQLELAEGLSRCRPDFRSSLEDHYYAVYEVPHFARALFVTAAKADRLGPLVALLEGGAAVAGDEEDGFLASAFTGLPSAQIGLAILETVGARGVRLCERARQTMSQWLEGHCEESEMAALYMVRFGGSNFLAREAGRGIDAAIRVLRATGRDYVGLLLELASTDYPPTHFGVCRALGVLGDDRALPYLASCLSHEEKTMRASAVDALAQVGAPKAMELIRTMASDRAVQVQKAVKAALAQG